MLKGDTEEDFVIDCMLHECDRKCINEVARLWVQCLL